MRPANLPFLQAFLIGLASLGLGLLILGLSTDTLSPQPSAGARQQPAADSEGLAQTGEARLGGTPDSQPESVSETSADETKAEPGAEAAEAERAQRPSPVRVHTVSAGESLRGVAEHYGVTSETLVAVNSLAQPDLLRVGQELVVPTVDGLLHTVAVGETLVGIANRYGVGLPELIATNHLAEAPDELSVGTQLVVPGARLVVAQAPPAAPPSAGEQRAARESSAPLPIPSTYVVREGDTLRSIAQAFGMDILSLLAVNRLANPDVITPGTTLRIARDEAVEHTVKPGETLANIAWRYSIPSALLLETNGVRNPDLIAVGATLIVPGASAREAAAASPPAPAQAPAAARAAPAAAPAAPAATARNTRSAAPAPQRQPAAPAPAAPAAPAPASASGDRVITAKVTGYALGAGASSTRTASGTQTHWGTVAADTRLFPFGTRLRIEGIGDTVFVVEDTGSAVRGNVFDVWFPDAASARRLGAQTRTVTILG